jgi:hypothetical protein
MVINPWAQAPVAVPTRASGPAPSYSGTSEAAAASLERPARRCFAALEDGENLG